MPRVNRAATNTSPTESMRNQVNASHDIVLAMAISEVRMALYGMECRRYAGPVLHAGPVEVRVPPKSTSVDLTIQPLIFEVNPC